MNPRSGRVPWGKVTSNDWERWEPPIWPICIYIYICVCVCGITYGNPLQFHWKRRSSHVPPQLVSGNGCNPPISSWSVSYCVFKAPLAYWYIHSCLSMLKLYPYNSIPPGWYDMKWHLEVLLQKDTVGNQSTYKLRFLPFLVFLWEGGHLLITKSHVSFLRKCIWSQNHIVVIKKRCRTAWNMFPQHFVTS
jgi:hypothetical protein